MTIPSKRPRTSAQRLADYRKTFPKKVNERRLELIVKEFGEPDPERDRWKFVEHPGWREECDRRCHANLTDAERVELAECTRIVDEWAKRSPLWVDRMEETLAAFEAFVGEIRAREAAKRGGITP